jgi:transglutaminase-like putative cysteine protease
MFMRLNPLPLACLLAASFAAAAPVTVMQENDVYDVNADGTYTLSSQLSVRIDEAQAVTQFGQIPLPFSESLQKLDIIEAYTTTKDGKRVDVPTDKITVQQLPASTGAPTFSDYKLKMVIFPQVEVGSVLNLRYTRTQLKPNLPGVFSMRNSFSRLMDYKGGSVTLRAPASLALHVTARGVTGGETKASKPGAHEWHWTYGEATALTPEPNSVATEDFSPFVAVSTLKDYPAMAAAYMIGTTAAAKVTPGVQKLADEITKDITDKRAQAEAIYRWVSSNIRYVALFMNVGGYVPHNADDIIAAAYGDCKDKSTLLTALLNAKGIRSAPVLINATSSYQLPDVAVLEAFNHAINYLPDFNLFVDSTSGFARFGGATDSLRGKQGLVTAIDGKPAALVTLPTGEAATDRLVVRTTATLAADGTVTGTSRIEPTGYFEPLFRATLGSIPAAALPQVGAQLLGARGYPGNATLSFGDVRDLTKPAALQVEFKTPARVNIPGPGAITGAFGILPLLDIGSFAAGTLRVERKLGANCLNTGLDERVELTLPAEVKITTLPRPATVTSPLGNYTSTYTQDQNRLVIARQLELQHPQVVCNAADSTELRKFATAISQDLRSQILYQ